MEEESNDIGFGFCIKSNSVSDKLDELEDFYNSSNVSIFIGVLKLGVILC